MMIEIYEYDNDPSLAWNDQQTYLCVYDKKNIQIADYDFDTGIKLMLSENKIKVYIEDSNLVTGDWTFFGVLSTIKNGKIVDRQEIEISGSEQGTASSRIYDDNDPWRFDYRPGTYILASEREQRISICRTCPFFNRKGFCESNNTLAIERTKMKIGFCPEGKWGSEAEAAEAYQKEFVGENAVASIANDQKEFEAELEQFLKGL